MLVLSLIRFISFRFKFNQLYLFRSKYDFFYELKVIFMKRIEMLTYEVVLLKPLLIVHCSFNRYVFVGLLLSLFFCTKKLSNIYSWPGVVSLIIPLFQKSFYPWLITLIKQANKPHYVLVIMFWDIFLSVFPDNRAIRMDYVFIIHVKTVDAKILMFPTDYILL